MKSLSVLLILCLSLRALCTTTCVVTSSGGDDTSSIVSAFTTCKSGGIIQFTAGKTYLFNTPGTTLATLSGTTIELNGNIVFPASTAYTSVARYLTIKGANVNITGSGGIDGNGQVYWNAGITSGRPKLVQFALTGTSSITGISIHDSPSQHISLSGSTNLVIKNVKVFVTWSRLTGGNQPKNTDGFDISSATGVQIINTLVDNGDDCVAVNGGVKNLYISGMNCSNGHGISIGSLGNGNANDTVEGVIVTQSTFYNTQHSVRIKTYKVSSGNTGYVKNITYSNLSIHGNTAEPICVTQAYCNDGACGSGTVGFDLTGATFSGITFSGMNFKYDMVSIWCVTPSTCGPWHFSGVTIPSGGAVGCGGVSTSQISGLTCSATLSSGCN